MNRSSLDQTYDVYLEPKRRAYVYWLVEMPEESGESSDPVSVWISFSIEDAIYICKVR